MSQKDARKKEEELYFASEFAKRAKLGWHVRASGSEADAPDLIVATTQGEFGLEHTQVFVGPQTRAAGSSLRAEEAERAGRGKKILAECEGKLGATLHIQISSHVYRHAPKRVFGFDRLTDEEVVAAICSLPINASNIGERHSISEFHRCNVWVKRVYRSRWEFIQDGVGFVAQSSEPVQAAVADKAKRLAKHRSNGMLDVRLLVVANRIRNSGKLILPDDSQIDRMGFDRVYFFSYPDQTVEF